MSSMLNSNRVLYSDDFPGGRMRIVAVDDYFDAVGFLKKVLQDYDVVGFVEAEEALRYLASNHFDLLIVDQKMPSMSGTELVKSIPPRPFVYLSLVLSAYTDADDLVEAVNSNLIYRYIVKPSSPAILLQTVARAAEHLSALREQRRLEELLRERNAFLESENGRLRSTEQSSLDRMVGVSDAIARIKEKIRRYGPSEQSVLITGETGVGKELVARALHENSNRRTGEFVAVNCAALPEHLVEAELFGVEKGAFTGASTMRDGLVVRAKDGTLFLDEISELPEPLQGKLLRFAQFGTYYRVGSSTEQQADVRIISATNRSVDPNAPESRLRADLYYRLAALEIAVPPLRDRREDIHPIAHAIALRKGLPRVSFSPETTATFLAHQFPGNVRELENLVERALLEGEALGCEDDPAPGPDLDAPFSLATYIEEVEAAIIRRTLAAHHGNISATARALDLSRQGIHNKLRRYGIANSTSVPVLEDT